MCLKNLDRLRDVGLLILRLGLGGLFVYFGAPSLFGGPEKWEGLGKFGMGTLGISFAPTFWGFMAAFSECVGGLCLIIGLFTRPACLLMMITMIVAASTHLVGGDGFQKASPAMMDGIVFLSLALIGPGKFSLDKKFCPVEKSST